MMTTQLAALIAVRPSSLSEVRRCARAVIAADDGRRRLGRQDDRKKSRKPSAREAQ